MRVSRALARVLTSANPYKPFMGEGRVRVSRAQARHCGRDARAPRGAILAPASALYPVIPAKAGIQTAADFAEGAERCDAKGAGRKKSGGDRGTQATNLGIANAALSPNIPTTAG